MDKLIIKAWIKVAGISLSAFLFLILSFCPLRNAVYAMLQPVPSKAKLKVPEYAKIIAHDHCGISFVDKQISTTGKTIQDPITQLGWLKTNGWSIQEPVCGFNINYSFQFLSAPEPFGRIYLRNCCFRI